MHFCHGRLNPQSTTTQAMTTNNKTRPIQKPGTILMCPEPNNYGIFIGTGVTRLGEPVFIEIIMPLKKLEPGMCRSGRAYSHIDKFTVVIDDEIQDRFFNRSEADRLIQKFIETH